MSPGDWVTLAAYGVVTGDRGGVRQVVDVASGLELLAITGLSAAGYLPPQAAAAAPLYTTLQKKLGGELLDRAQDVFKHAFP